MRRNITFFVVLFFICLSIAITGCSHKNVANIKKRNSLAEEINRYRIEVAYAILKNWEFVNSPELDQNLETKIVIKIMPNGEIKEIFYVESSGNKLLDDSVYKTIERTNPTKPFPKNITAPYIQLGLRFGPKGVK